MSADNFLMIGIHAKRVYVIDANFSDFSSRDDWNRRFDTDDLKIIRAAVGRLTKDAIKYSKPIWVSDEVRDGKPEEQRLRALAQANQYWTSGRNIVEYGVIDLLNN